MKEACFEMKHLTSERIRPAGGQTWGAGATEQGVRSHCRVAWRCRVDEDVEVPVKHQSILDFYVLPTVFMVRFVKNVRLRPEPMPPDNS